VIPFHRVLIATAIAFSLGFAVWSAWAYARAGEGWALASALGFGAATVAWVLYLKNLRKFLGR
jgi:hypothetical protein